MAEPKSDILQQLVSITSDQKPFAVMGLDTIGKDDSREIFHVVTQKFTYDDTTDQYESKSRLELMQKCSQEIPQGDLKRFGIIDTYANGALDSMEFANKLTAFVVEELDDSLLIVNGNDSVVNSLTKVNGCESLYADKEEQGLAMNSFSLIGAYMQEHDVTGNTPRAYLKYIKAEDTKSETCDEKIAAVSSLIKKCREEYGFPVEKTAPVVETPQKNQENLFESELSELAAATENTFDDFLKEFHAEQLSTKEEEPVAEMPPKQKVYHIEMDFTPEQQAVIDGMKKQDDELHEAWVEKGKKTYREGTVEQKLGILKKTGIVTDKTEDLTVLREMYQMLDRECGDGKKNNGFTVLQAGTTGLQAGNRVTQVAFATYDIDETGMVKIAGFSRLVCADMEYVQKAEQIAQSGGFDAFAHGGIDLEKYKALCEAGVSNKAEKFCTITALGNAIAKYFESYPVSQYPIVSAGMANRIKDIPEKYRKTVSYSQGALLQSINNESLTREPIDFAQFIKEYTAAALTAEEYKGENVLFPGKTPPDNLKNFGLDAIAEQNGKDITGVVARCTFMAEMVGKIYEQHLEMEKSRELAGHAEARAEAIQRRYDRAVQRKEESGFQEESFQKPENQELLPVPPEDALQEQSQNNALNQKIAGLSETAQKFTAEMSKPAPAPAEHTQHSAPAHTDTNLYDSLNKVSSAMAENNAAVQVLAHGLTVQNANNSQTNENIGQLIATLNTMITTLQDNIKSQKEESRAVISALEKQILVQEEQLKTQKAENAQLLATIRQLAEVSAQTQEQLLAVNENVAQTQQQNVHMLETQNTYAQATSTLVQEVASVKADGADTKESLALFRQETKDSFDRTNQTFAQYSTTLQHYGTEIANIKTATRENTAEIQRVRSEFSKRFSFIAQNSATMAEIAKEQSGQLELLGKNQNELASGFVELHDKVTVIDTKLTDMKRMPHTEYHKDVIEEDEDMDYDDIEYPAYPSGDYPRAEYSGRY